MIRRYRKCLASLNSTRSTNSKPTKDEQTPPDIWQRVLVPIEFSQRSSTLLGCARKLAALDGSEIVLLHVVQPLHAVRDFGYGPVILARPNARLRALAQRQLGPAYSWSICVRSGSVCEEILRVSREMEVGIIIMASDGLLPPDPVKGAGMAARVISRSSCPVLVLKNQFRERPRNL